jgi:hypothetical protein
VATLALGGCGEAPVKLQPPPAGAPPLIVGVIANTLGAGSAMGAEQHRVNSLGVRWIREELDWTSAEPQPGVFTWGEFDRLLQSAAAHRLRVLPLLLGTPGWAGPRSLGLPDDPRAFAAFAAAAAARYGPSGSFWHAHPELDSKLAPQWFELWNEPYTLSYSRGGVDPARYAAMVLDAGRAGRAANPRTRWLMAADLEYKNSSGARVDWLAALYAAEPKLNAGFDGVAVHPYSFYSPNAGPDTADIDFRFDRVGAIEDELTAHGAGRKPMWITELGWSTCDLRPDCASAHDQAQWLADAFAKVRSTYASFVRAVFVYHLIDFPDHAQSDPAGRFGLLSVDGSHKPAWSVVNAEARLAVR